MEKGRGDSLKLLNGLYGDNLEKVTQINKWYDIYEGKQLWETNTELDYEPTKKVTNYIKKLIDTKARFMFGKEPFFDVKAVNKDDKDSTVYADEAQEKEDLLIKILKANKFHSKLLKAKKDCSIGGRVAIKLWGHRDKGLKIIFSPAQEFFPIYNIDDVDVLEKVTFLYSLNNEDSPMEQRFKKQSWEMANGKCILNEGIYDGNGEIIEVIEVDKNTGLDFIPIIIIQNGGLTGETEGISDVQQLWDEQDTYNRLKSDDMDSLKFNMFPQRVATDTDENSLKNMTIAPGALVDLQTDIAQANQGRQAKLEITESHFSYSEKYIDTINRTKNDMFDLMDVPNVSLEQLKGLMTSGKSMRALYWGLINVTEEAGTEWDVALNEMIEFIFKMVEVYNLYGAKKVAAYETTLDIIRTYPIEEDTNEEKRMDLEEVIAEVRSKASYISKWNINDDEMEMLYQIQLEKQILEDSFTRELIEDTEMGE